MATIITIEVSALDTLHDAGSSPPVCSRRTPMLEAAGVDGARPFGDLPVHDAAVHQAPHNELSGASLSLFYHP